MNEWIIGFISFVSSIFAIFTFFGIPTFNRIREYQRVSASSKPKSKDNSCEALQGKLLRWIMFSIVLSLLPLGMKVFSLSTRAHEFSWSIIASHGELLIIIITMCTTAIAELFCSGSKNKLWKLIAGSLTISVLIISSGYFSDISVAFELSQSAKFDFFAILMYQVWLFVIAFGLGLLCIFLSET